MFNFIKKALSKKIDASTKEDLFDYMISADFGMEKTEKILKEISHETKDTHEKLKQFLIKELNPLKNNSNPKLSEGIPPCFVFLGINGAGKTTMLAKIANLYHAENKKVLIGACDTYRASATQQLEHWAKKIGCDFLSDDGVEPAAVAYKTYKKAIDENYDICLIDTAGRLSNNDNLMAELKKIVNVLEKLSDSASIFPLLVLDGTSGQNAITQTEKFGAHIPLKGLIINKLDTSSKAGFIFQLTDKKIPVWYLGYGEKLSDLAPFTPEEFLKDF